MEQALKKRYDFVSGKATLSATLKKGLKIVGIDIVYSFSLAT